MATMFIRHRVKDYTAWRAVYDAFEGTQKAMGVIAEEVYQAADDPNDLTVTHDFATLEAARAFDRSTELRDAMADAGVLGQPNVWFTNRA